MNLDFPDAERLQAATDHSVDDLPRFAVAHRERDIDSVDDPERAGRDAVGEIAAFESGALDVPFAPSDSAQAAVLPARDDDGRVRILEWGDLAVPDEIRAIHENRLDERARTEGRDRSFRMVADDVDAISDGKLIGRPSADPTESAGSAASGTRATGGGSGGAEPGGDGGAD